MSSINIWHIYLYTHTHTNRYLCVHECVGMHRVNMCMSLSQNRYKCINIYMNLPGDVPLLTLINSLVEFYITSANCALRLSSSAKSWSWFSFWRSICCMCPCLSSSVACWCSWYWRTSSCRMSSKRSSYSNSWLDASVSAAAVSPERWNSATISAF